MSIIPKRPEGLNAPRVGPGLAAIQIARLAHEWQLAGTADSLRPDLTMRRVEESGSVLAHPPDPPCRDKSRSFILGSRSTRSLPKLIMLVLPLLQMCFLIDLQCFCTQAVPGRASARAPDCQLPGRGERSRLRQWHGRECRVGKDPTFPM